MADSAVTGTAMIAAGEALAARAEETATATATEIATTAAPEDTAETEAMAAAAAAATRTVATTEATTAATIVRIAAAATVVATEVATIAVEEAAGTTTTEVASTGTLAAMIGTLDPVVAVPVAAAAAALSEDTTVAIEAATALHGTPLLLLAATVTRRRGPRLGTPTVVRAIPMFSTVIPTLPVMDVTEFSRCPLSNVTARAKRPNAQLVRSRFSASPTVSVSSSACRSFLRSWGYGKWSVFENITSLRSWSFSAL